MNMRHKNQSCPEYSAGYAEGVPGPGHQLCGAELQGRPGVVVPGNLDVTTPLPPTVGLPGKFKFLGGVGSGQLQASPTVSRH